MSDIKIPTGMLDAAMVRSDRSNRKYVMRGIEEIVEASLRWLSGELEKMRNSNTTPWQAGYNVALDDVRNIFLAEPELDPIVMYVMRHFDDVEHDPRTLKNRAEAAVADYQEHVKRNRPKDIVPEEIKYLLLKEDIPEADFSRPTRGFFNTAVTEAFYRGKQSKGTK